MTSEKKRIPRVCLWEPEQIIQQMIELVPLIRLAPSWWTAGHVSNLGVGGLNQAFILQESIIRQLLEGLIEQADNRQLPTRTLRSALRSLPGIISMHQMVYGPVNGLDQPLVELKMASEYR